jgi:AraC family transcriptional activator of pobA
MDGTPDIGMRRKLERVIELYLGKCYAERSSARVSELAQYLRISRQHLSALCRAVLGTTAHGALRTRQLLYAERLLRTTPLSTLEIASLAGFGAESTFFRQFNAHYGVTPVEFRKQATNC